VTTTIDWSVENDAMNLGFEAARQAQLAFNVDYVPVQFSYRRRIDFISLPNPMHDKGVVPSARFRAFASLSTRQRAAGLR